jgi:hypothetical protein
MLSKKKVLSKLFPWTFCKCLQTASEGALVVPCDLPQVPKKRVLSSPKIPQ